jgi:hypothetical protein
MNDVATTIEAYLAMWNETNAARRDDHIDRAWTDDGRYVDPVIESEGHAGLSKMITDLQAQFPGHRFRQVNGIDLHHDQVRLAWEVVAPDGTVTSTGIDVGTVAADGRLQRIVSFTGPLPEAAETTGSFATGQAAVDARPWSKRQMVADGLRSTVAEFSRQPVVR